VSDETQQAEAPAQQQAEQQRSRERELALIERGREQDHTVFRKGMTVFNAGNAFGLACRMAERMANSTFLPKEFQGNADNCLVLVDYAARLGMSPIALASQMPIVNNKPTLQGQMVLGLLNTSGLFDGRVRFEWCGPEVDPTKREQDPATGCRAWVMENGERINGPWVTWAMAKAEGWVGKDRSKWPTMPELMFKYRAATFLGRTEYAEVLLGIAVTEEQEDIHGYLEAEYSRVDRPQTSADRLNDRLDALHREGEERREGGIQDAEFTDVKTDAKPDATPPPAETKPGPRRRSVPKREVSAEPPPAGELHGEEATPATTPAAQPQADAFNVE